MDEVKYKYKIGDEVEYTNPNGIYIGEKIIIRLDIRTNLPTYYIYPTDTPWFSVRETGLKLINQ